ncbi:MAG: class I SAM-dependent methyltransferase [Deltaproteobacteria bacterium]|jgi:cyclopropane-fatty-acyl-phospholipid synthase|nr:class I SAM-dependent methyltransferase [Deltaproteobacteria bacterium]
MTDFIIPAEAPHLDELKAGNLERLARLTVLSVLEKLKFGRIRIIEDQSQLTFGKDDSAALQASLHIHHERFYSRILFNGSIGAAEAYMEGLWSTDDLTMVMRIMELNQTVFAEMEKGLARLTTPVYKAYHWARKNTRMGSRKNILAHYDLGNSFYALFLDPTMTYSCGIFEHEHSTLEEASIAKYDRICQKLQLTPGDRVVEIGTGWGGFVLHAVKNYDVHVTTTTISDEQYRFSRERFKKAGILDRVRLLKEDYRNMKGRFDKLVSIEMIEAVGHQYFDTFFRTCSQLLHDRGMMLIQAITIQDQEFKRYVHTVDFIKRYIFPGGCLTSVAAMLASIARVTDLRIFHLEDITPHYARTLREWRKRFFANIQKVRALKFPETFIRMWEYYLCYCEGGFAERYIGNVQMLLTKPLCRRDALLPDIGNFN